MQRETGLPRRSWNGSDDGTEIEAVPEVALPIAKLVRVGDGVLQDDKAIRENRVSIDPEQGPAHTRARTQPESASACLLAAALVSDVQHRHGTAVPGAIVDRVAHGAGFVEAFVLEACETPDETAARVWQIYRRWTSWIPAATSAFSLWIGILVLAVVAFVATLRKRWQRRRQWDREERSTPDTLL